jgi:hypothetical protein
MRRGKKLKLISKKDCRYENGYIVNADNELLCLDHKVEKQMALLDLVCQKLTHLEAQPVFQPAPSLCDFHRVTAAEKFRSWTPIEEPETPTIDARVESSKAYRDELITQNDVRTANQIASQMFEELLDFCANEKFVEGLGMPERIDCVSLGNPLELTASEVMRKLLWISKSPFACYIHEIDDADDGDINGKIRF